MLYSHKHLFCMNITISVPYTHNMLYQAVRYALYSCLYSFLTIFLCLVAYSSLNTCVSYIHASVRIISTTEGYTACYTGSTHYSLPSSITLLVYRLYKDIQLLYCLISYREVSICNKMSYKQELTIHHFLQPSIHSTTNNTCAFYTPVHFVVIIYQPSISSLSLNENHSIHVIPVLQPTVDNN